MSGKSPRCSTNMATILLVSVPSSMSSTVFLAASGLFMNCMSRPHWLRSSMASFRWLQSSVTCPWHLWNQQYFVLSTPLPLLRWSLWWLDASFCQIGHCDLDENFLPRHGQGCILDEVTVGSFAFTSYLAFPLFLMEGLFGGFISRLFLSGFVEAVRIQLLFICDVDLCDC